MKKEDKYETLISKINVGAEDDKIEIKEAIAKGGMGLVSLARDKSINRDIAVKVLHDELQNDKDMCMQFLDEAHIESLAGQQLKSNEDALDSIICLYIAGLYERRLSGQVFGNTESGYIWVPQELCI